MLPATKEAPVTSGAVKNLINQKFGNVSRFCLITGRDIFNVHNILKSATVNEAELLAIHNLALQTRNQHTRNEIRARERNLLKREVSAAGGQNEFCKKYGFTPEVISRILNRNSKNLSKRVKEVFIKLEIL